MKRNSNKYSFIILIILVSMLTACNQDRNNTFSLEGEWQFQEDPEDIGIQEKWFQQSFEDKILLPGSMRENGKGNDPDLNTPWTASIYDSSWYFNPAMEKYRQPGNMKFPFWLTPVKYYLGAAWYKRSFIVPEEMKNKRLTLYLERPHWETSIWFDSTFIGTQNSLSTPHIFELPKVQDDNEHSIVIRVDNRSLKVDVGQDSHSISDHTQGNWNGIVGDIAIAATEDFYIEDLQLFPNVEDKSVKAVIVIGSSTKVPFQGKVKLEAQSFNSDSKHIVEPISLNVSSSIGDTIEVVYTMGEKVQLWDEFNPALYTINVTLSAEGTALDEKNIQFGMRDFSIAGTRFTINGRPVFLRGTLENCQFPLTGYPPTNEDDWLEVFQKCKASGLNHMRFHSFCPPEAAFSAADKLGFYLQPEAASWANHGTSLGRGRPVDQYILDETERIIRQYGNHPSFCMWAYGNEPRGPYVKFLDDYLRYWKKKDKRRVYTGASIGMSWSIVPESEFLVRSGPRGLPFNHQPNSLFNFNHKIKDEFRPYVTHEMGQYCVYPNFNEIPKYTGVHKAKNFEMFQEDLVDHHMGDQAHDFLMASGKLQALCYKAEIEATLRTNGLAGYQLLGLPDFPGQGSAIVGMLDVFWDEKGYITYDEIKKFQSETVPLAEFEKFEYVNSDTLTVNVKVAHFGSKSITNATPEWQISTADGSILASGSLSEQNINIGDSSVIGQIKWPLDSIRVASKLILALTIQNHSNQWEFWVYPEQLSKNNNSNLYICTSLNDSAKLILNEGGSVLLMAAGKVENGKDVKQYFTPVFWNTSWFKMRPPHTIGVYIQNQHPLFKDFPTEYHSNYQWWSILNRQQVINLENFPPSFRPIVQPIDTWFLNRRLGMIFEASVGNGKLLVCSANLEGWMDKSPAARQLNHALVKYASGSEFNPENNLDFSVVEELFEKKERMGVNMYTKGSPDELKPNKKPKK